MTIAEHPFVGSIWLELVQAPYRCLSLIGFPYVIIYYSDRRSPLIVRILHGALDLPAILHDL